MTLDEMLSGTFPLDGRQVPFTLKLATVERTLNRIYDPVEDPTSTLQVPLRTMVSSDLASIDGGRVKPEVVDRIVAEPAALAAVLAKRNDFYEWALQEGRLYALCPHCREREPDWSLFGLGVGLRSELPPLFRPDGVFLAIPRVERPVGVGRRPRGVPLAAQLRFELPSHRLGLGDRKRATGGTLAPLDLDRMRALWDKWLVPGLNEPIGRSWWREDALGFRSILTVATAIAKLDRGGPPSPEKLMPWPAIDFLFVSSLRAMTLLVDVPPESSLVYRCACGGQFLPVTANPHQAA